MSFRHCLPFWIDVIPLLISRVVGPGQSFVNFHFRAIQANDGTKFRALSRSLRQKHPRKNSGSNHERLGSATRLISNHSTQCQSIWIPGTVEREFEQAVAEKKEELRQIDQSILRVRQLLQARTKGDRVYRAHIHAVFLKHEKNVQYRLFS